MKKRLTRAVIAGMLAAAILSGCSRTSGGHPSSAPAGSGDAPRITVAASFYPMYIMLLNIAADMPNVDVVDMTQPTAGCLHDYAATPDDMKNLEKAKYLVINGAGMESFMDKIIRQFPDLKIIDASKNIEFIKADGDGGDNPHLWVSITNAIQQVQNIAGQLAALDPDNAGKFKSNAAAYVKKLEAERDKMHKALDDLPKRDIITFHEAFPYFAREFNLNIVGVIEREPGSEPSAKELGDTIDTIQSLKVQALFAEPQYPVSAAANISRETGLKVYVLDPAVTGPMDADAYLNIMDGNMKVLQEALK